MTHATHQLPESSSNLRMHHENLDAETRSYMLAELETDVREGTLQFSEYLTEEGWLQWGRLLWVALDREDDDWLAEMLWDGTLVRDPSSPADEQASIAKITVPRDAPQRVAESEFKRYYARGVCLRVIRDGQESVELCRGKAAYESHAGSELVVGSRLDATELLDRLRVSTSFEAAVGLPPDLDSGLTVRVPRPREVPDSR